ncbi:MAG: B12-binding domain-containing radical SAM protein [Phycisphaerales bacterium]
MPDIVLATFNAKYAHCAFGLRYILANLGELKPNATLLEFEISHRVTDAIEMILAHQPRIVGLGVYIWNIEQSTRFVAELKRIAPDTIIILGGPEVSHETDQQAIVQLADYTITGEGDLAFAPLCRRLLAGERPPEKIIAAPLPQTDGLTMPYDSYGDDDVAHRVIYVEASRGCPFRCEFCLSSLDVPVRAFELEPFLGEMRKLLARGLRQFKFVDRTFNLNIKTSRAILQFFLERHFDGLFVHFEMIPDNLPPQLREVIVKFPPGALQFEVGVQSFNEAVCARISRKQDPRKVEENITWLRRNTGVHIHADLIAGLPGEDLDSFAAGFDRLRALGPQEIQLGILKRLRGTPIARHDEAWGMVYSPNPPYEVLRTSVIDFATMQRIRRFAQCWDRVANSGRFRDTAPLIWGDGSCFTGFMAFTQWLYERVGRTHSIALPRLAELIGRYVIEQRGLPEHDVRVSLETDQQRWLDSRKQSASGRQAFHLT